MAPATTNIKIATAIFPPLPESSFGVFSTGITGVSGHSLGLSLSSLIGRKSSSTTSSIVVPYNLLLTAVTVFVIVFAKKFFNSSLSLSFSIFVSINCRTSYQTFPQFTFQLFSFSTLPIYTSLSVSLISVSSIA